MTQSEVNEIAKEAKKHSNVENPGMGNHLLIPVDFSDASLLAVRAGFRFAYMLGISPVLLHVYPETRASKPLFNQYMGISAADEGQMPEAEEEHDHQGIAETQLKKFRAHVKECVETGMVPDVKFSTLLLPGIPEEVILEYCRANKPRMVVMSTRGIHRKEEDLIGSVTAEVLDSCRVPVFTVPDNLNSAVADFKYVLMLCTMDSYDMVGLKKMMDTFDSPDIELWLMPMTRNNPEILEQRLSVMRDTIEKGWPSVRVNVTEIAHKEVNSSIDDFISFHGIQLVIAPNRKTSIFTRLFRPSVAHQCIFTLDVPMLALPVNNS